MVAMESGGVSPFPASRTSTPSSQNPNGPRQTKICVYCGSMPGESPAHMEAARELARTMAANNIGLVYGGGTVGLMGEVAKTLVALSGPDAVHGIIPEALVKYERDPTYTSTVVNGDKPLAIPEEKTFGKTTVVKDMHTRKQMMAQEVIAGGPGSGFIALSGGYGTMEELLEVCTWNQLGIHNRGVCVLNVDGFYDGLLEWIKKSVQQGFIKSRNADILVTATTAADAIKALRDYKVSEAVYKLSWGNE
ncbi:putative lysine decarboxylase protein [Phaeoacremonium minimum UCRPA7]|uniref:Putative lysine decarboxylase protein n=1 Tax=Phaeoacremonium minimum (strain UCR-PA7) TaxID=1286976 RepID=R8BBN1_PHAM7|nr:putative lysine decarboxylase protein [Phaeoacremonium minimum UCRPA7]EON96679.1 putative lysine decarboxylase protein [Phaeoacremonium minimum UCRPA7]